MRIEADGETISVSNADREVFPGEGITKGMLVEYYRDVAPVMLTHVADRPLALHRFPKGVVGEGFYQKQASGFFPGYIRRVDVPKKGGSTAMPVCDSGAGIVYLANQNTVTLHPWLSRAGALNHPDLVMFDLDPPDDRPFDDVRAVAFAVRDLLEEAKLPSFVKTSGSKGLHVVVPADGSCTFEETASFAHRAALALVARDPDRLTLEFSKQDRAGRIYVDIGRNTWAQHAAAAYSVRAKAGAPVSMPITWDELADPKTTPASWTIANARERLDKSGDAWTGLWDDPQPIAVAAGRLPEP